MRIQHMFHDDINRQINGVIKVDQKENEVIEQEVREYVITKELRKHFSAFLTTTAIPSMYLPQMWVCGSPASSEAVNPTF